jgi:hypothetical protein
MANWHLRDLEERLRQRGWQIVDVGDAKSVQLAATWEVERGRSRLLLDFYVDPEHALRSPEAAYAVQVRDHDNCGLYFGKRPTQGRPNRPWPDDLDAFVMALDGL